MACCTAVIGFSVPCRAQDGTAHAHYDGYIRGFDVFSLDIGVALRPAAYRLQLDFRLTGVVGALYHGEGTTVAEGRFDGVRAVPREMVSTGRFGGVAHVMQIDWQDGMPKVLQMVPPTDSDREAVPPQEQAHTMDALSAIGGLLRQVSATGRCESTTRTFDGARLTEYAARTVGLETLPATGRSSFQGEALRCDITGTMIGGFMRDADRQRGGRPKQGSAWFARLQPGQPMLPIRIAFYTDGVATVQIYVSDAPS